MKVVVTGGAGYIGNIVVAHLIHRGFEVTVFDKYLFGAESLLSFPREKFRLIQGDVRNQESLRSALKGIQAVVHLAAIVGEPACLVDPAAAKSINVEGTQTVLSTAIECGVDRLIFISTCSNYGVSLPNVWTDENAPLRPLSIYAASKVSAEEIILNCNASLARVIFRFGTICGLSARMRFDLLVNEIARSAVLKQPIRIFAPKAWRPFLHIKDAARAIESILTTARKQIEGKIFNVVSENCQKGDLGQLVANHFPEANIEITDSSPDPRDYRVSADKIKQEIGFIPAYTVEQAFLETAHAVKEGVFLNPLSVKHSAIPEQAEHLK